MLSEQEIDGLEVGDDLDRLLAGVMEWEAVRPHEWWDGRTLTQYVTSRDYPSLSPGALLTAYEFHPSSRIADAWQVVERMVAEVERTIYDPDRLRWEGPLFKASDRYLTHEGYPLGTTCWYVRVERGGRIWIVCADTPMLAICRAALKAAAHA